jgi:hypothetical protein
MCWKPDSPRHTRPLPQQQIGNPRIEQQPSRFPLRICEIDTMPALTTDDISKIFDIRSDRVWQIQSRARLKKPRHPAVCIGTYHGHPFLVDHFVFGE